MNISNAASKFDEPFLKGARKEEDIIAWARKVYEYTPPCYIYSFGDSRCFVVIPDIGSGISLPIILIYGSSDASNKFWHLAVVRYLKNTSVKIEQDKDILLFKSTDNIKLMSVSISSL